MEEEKTGAFNVRRRLGVDSTRGGCFRACGGVGGVWAGAHGSMASLQ
jgi:hypothetical protein